MSTIETVCHLARSTYLILFTGALLAQNSQLYGAETAPPRFTFETFDLPGAKETLLADIDNRGRLVGRFKDANDLSHGFFQDGTNVLRFNVTGNTATFAAGFDSMGRIVGFYRDKVDPDIQHGFLRQTNGTFVTIDSPANTTITYLWRLNDAGQMNGYHFEDDPFLIRSFQRAANGSFTTNIVFPGSPVGTVTRGMNEAGILTGWKWTDGFALQGVTVEGTNFTSVFTVPGWANTLPGDINNAGEIAGTVINSDFSDRRGFFRASDGRTSVFAPSGATETEVFGLNGLGQIVGEYVDQAGKRHGFIASPAVGLDKGHTDIGIAFEDGKWDLHVHSEGTDTEYVPDGVVLQFGATSELPISDSLDFRFLGDVGRSTWILPQVESEELLFLGLAAEEIGDGVFVNNVLRVELASVEGPGNFFVWTADPLGKPKLHFNSADGILSSQDIYLLKTGGHQDMNWAFSAPGTYRVGYRVSGTLVAGNKFTQSGVAYYTFEVPEAKLPQPPAPDTMVYNVIDLGTFGGSAFANALGINQAGDVVGGANFPDNKKFHPYRFSGNGPKEDLGTAGGEIAGANDINEAGEITGTTFLVPGQDEPYLPFRYTTNGVMQVITNTLGGLNGEAAAINEGGRIVGAAEVAAGKFETVAFYADANNVMRSLGTFGGPESRSENINDAGYIVGSAQLANGERRAFRHLGTGPLNPTNDNLGTLGGNRSQAHAINAAGKVTGTARVAGNASSPAFLWEKNKGMISLGTLGSGTLAYGFAIDTNDVVVGWSLTKGGDFDSAEAFVWDRVNGMRNLNDLVPRRLGLRLTGAYGINDAGWIVGTATRSGTGAATPVLLKPATRLTAGHTDIGALYTTNGWELEVHSETLEKEFEPGAALLQLPALTQTVVPTNTAFAFLGAAGAPVWVLSQVQHPKLLFLGLAAEEIEKGIFASDEIQFTLKNVEGPGHFFLYAVDGFRNPIIYWNSRDGVGTNDTRTILAGGHEDLNWAFTAPGYYRVTIQASGQLVDGNRFTQSDDVTYHFEVVGVDPHLTLAPTNPTTLALTVTTEDGIIYQLQSAASLAGPWNDVAQPFIGTGRTKQFSIPVTSGSGFYRVITSSGN